MNEFILRKLLDGYTYVLEQKVKGFDILLVYRVFKIQTVFVFTYSFNGQNDVANELKLKI